MYIVYIHTEFSDLIHWLINYQQQSEGWICVSKYNETIKYNLFACVCVCVFYIKTPFIPDIFQTFEVVINGMKLYQLTKCRRVKIGEF